MRGMARVARWACAAVLVIAACSSSKDKNSGGVTAGRRAVRQCRERRQRQRGGSGRQQRQQRQGRKQQHDRRHVRRRPCPHEPHHTARDVGARWFVQHDHGLSRQRRAIRDAVPRKSERTLGGAAQRADRSAARRGHAPRERGRVRRGGVRQPAELSVPGPIRSRRRSTTCRRCKTRCRPCSPACTRRPASRST